MQFRLSGPSRIRRDHGHQWKQVQSLYRSQMFWNFCTSYQYFVLVHKPWWNFRTSYQYIVLVYKPWSNQILLYWLGRSTLEGTCPHWRVPLLRPIKCHDIFSVPRFELEVQFKTGGQRFCLHNQIRVPRKCLFKCLVNIPVPQFGNIQVPQFEFKTGGQRCCLHNQTRVPRKCLG